MTTKQDVLATVQELLALQGTYPDQREANAAEQLGYRRIRELHAQLDDLVEAHRPPEAEFPYDRETAYRGVEDGIEWVAYRGAGMTHTNGYVKLPTDHPWRRYGLDGWNDHWDGVDTHGGITYALGDWIGFDTVHARDYWPGAREAIGWAPREPGPGDIIWTDRKVAKEARKLARLIRREQA